MQRPQNNALLRLFLLPLLLFALLTGNAAAQRPMRPSPMHDGTPPHLRDAHGPRHGEGEKPPPFDPQAFRRDFEAFVTKRAGLTPKEATAFFPQFHKMKDQERDLRGKIGRILHRAKTERLSASDSRRLMKEVLRLRREAADLETRSYDNFLKILPADKLLRVMEAERAFGKEMFRKGPHDGNGPHPRR